MTYWPGVGRLQQNHFVARGCANLICVTIVTIGRRLLDTDAAWTWSGHQVRVSESQRGVMVSVRRSARSPRRSRSECSEMTRRAAISGATRHDILHVRDEPSSADRLRRPCSGGSPPTTGIDRRVVARERPLSRGRHTMPTAARRESTPETRATHAACAVRELPRRGWPGLLGVQEVGGSNPLAPTNASGAESVSCGDGWERHLRPSGRPNRLQVL